jgi:hypothetical protein
MSSNHPFLHMLARRSEGFCNTLRCAGVISSTHDGNDTSPTPAESAQCQSYFNQRNGEEYGLQTNASYLYDRSIKDAHTPSCRVKTCLHHNRKVKRKHTMDQKVRARCCTLTNKRAPIVGGLYPRQSSMRRCLRHNNTVSSVCINLLDVLREAVTVLD